GCSSSPPPDPAAERSRASKAGARSDPNPASQPRLEPIQGRKTFHLAKSPAPAYVKTRVRQAASAVSYPCRSARGALANTKQPRSVRPDGERLQWKREHSIRRRENQTARRRSSGILTFAANSRLESVLVSLFPAAKAKNRPSLKISCNVTPVAMGCEDRRNRL